MAGRLLLCLLLLCSLTSYSVCGKFSFGRGSSRSGSSWGRSWGSSSASKPSFSSSFGRSKPSSSSSSFGWGSSAPKYPSSSSGLSGFGSSAPKYPSSSSGLSGFSSSVPKYPSSFGLSGFGSSAPKYPSSSSGLSGGGSYLYPSSSSGLSGFTWTAPPSFGSGSNKYPASTGLSGFGSNKYPASTGLSGSGTESKYPASTGLSGSGYGNNRRPSISLSGSGSGSKYPASIGLSGSGIQKPSYNYPTSSNSNIKPSTTHLSTNSYDKNIGYGSGHSSQNYGYGSGSHGYNYGIYNTPTYFTAPQRIYITEYRNSGSRYSDLLTGLALYNLGRSHSNYHHHYYNDDYYRRRYYSGDTTAYEKPKDEATCNLKIKENGKVEILKIPCEIVSTFTDGSKKVAPETITQTVCVSNYTVINNTIPGAINSNISVVGSIPKIIPTPANISALNSTLPPLNASVAVAEIQSKLDNTSYISAHNNITFPLLNITSSTDVPISSTTQSNISITNITSSTMSNLNMSTILSNNNTNNNFTNTTAYTFTSSNITFMNSTNCTVTKDPLTVKGPPVNASNMECEVDIVAKNSLIMRSKIDCNVLLEYAKMPEPKKQSSGILPERKKLKSWLSNPPWWLSLFIAI